MAIFAPNLSPRVGHVSYSVASLATNTYVEHLLEILGLQLASFSCSSSSTTRPLKTSHTFFPLVASNFTPSHHWLFLSIVYRAPLPNRAHNHTHPSYTRHHGTTRYSCLRHNSRIFVRNYRAITSITSHCFDSPCLWRYTPPCLLINTPQLVIHVCTVTLSHFIGTIVPSYPHRYIALTIYTPSLFVCADIPLHNNTLPRHHSWFLFSPSHFPHNSSNNIHQRDRYRTNPPEIAY